MLPENDAGRTRIGNTPTCEDCGEPLDHCTCGEEGINQMPRTIKSDAELLAECEALDQCYADAARLDAERYEASLCRAPIEGGLCAQPKGHEADGVAHALVIDSEYLDGEWPVDMGWIGKDGRP